MNIMYHLKISGLEGDCLLRRTLAGLGHAGSSWDYTLWACPDSQEPELFSPGNYHLMWGPGWVLLRGGDSCSALSLFVQQMIPLSPTTICVFPEVFYSRNGGEVLPSTGFLPQPSKTSKIWIYLREKMALILFPWETEHKELFLRLFVGWTKK